MNELAGNATKHIPSQPTSIAPEFTPPMYIEFQKTEIEQSIPDRFEKQVEQHPHLIAVKTITQTLTYLTLNQTANRIARTLLAAQTTSQETVVLLLEHEAQMITAIIGVLKAGKIGVPLDPLFPYSRLLYILEDSRAAFIITNDRNLTLATQLNVNKLPLINLDTLDSNLSAENVNLPISPHTLAYLFYTSGSTGQPKAVIHNHRNLLHATMNCTNGLKICATDRLSLLIACSFIGPVRDLFSALLNGASIYPLDIKQHGIAHLAHWLTTAAITIYYAPTTLFRYLVTTLSEDNSLPHLRIIRLGGEPVDTRDVAHYKKFFSDKCLLVNGLGSTEALTYRWYFIAKTTQIEGKIVPAGYALPDQNMLLLNEMGHEVEPGQSGEIAIQSRYLACGYWRQPALTKAAFLPASEKGERLYRTGDLGKCLPNGSLLYLGRKDFQVKIRGYRVELAEVELTLLKHEAVKAAVVLAQKDHVSNTRLVAYLIPQTQTAIVPRQLRHFLQQRLPDYMLPAAYIILDHLPITPTGKLDRQALPTSQPVHHALQTQFVPPRTKLEKTLTTLWREVLELERIGIYDNFFELGGHSLSAARLLILIKQITGQNIPMSTLFQRPTIAQLGFVLEQEKTAPLDHSLIPLQTQGSNPPFFCLPGNLGNVFTDLDDLAHHLGPNQPFYALQDGLHNPLYIEQVATRYLQEIQAVQTHGPYFLGGVCSGGIIAYEMAQQLRARGQQVALLALIEPARRTITKSWAYAEVIKFILRGFVRRLPFLSQVNQPATKVELNAPTFLSPGCSSWKYYLAIKKRLIANEWAAKRYIPQPYPGHVHLFLTEESLTIRGHAQHGWPPLAIEGTSLHHIPGNHATITGDNNTIIVPAYMQALAKQLSKCLLAARAKYQ